MKYHPGDFFRIHKDGSFVRENGEKSLITMLFYLNEGYKGGKTTFYKQEKLLQGLKGVGENKQWQKSMTQRFFVFRA